MTARVTDFEQPFHLHLLCYCFSLFLTPFPPLASPLVNAMVRFRWTQCSGEDLQDVSSKDHRIQQYQWFPLLK